MDTDRELARLDALATLLDSRWRIPGIGARVGLDALLGLVPVVGDSVAAALSAWLVWRAHRLGAPAWLLALMTANIGIDWLIGAVPVIGDLLDVAWKANRRNVDLLARWLRARPADYDGDRRVPLLPTAT